MDHQKAHQKARDHRMRMFLLEWIITFGIKPAGFIRYAHLKAYGIDANASEGQARGYLSYDPMTFTYSITQEGLEFINNGQD